MEGIRLGFALCGSFCTFAKVVTQIEAMKSQGYEVYPIMSEFAYATDTRFGKARDFIEQIERICGKATIHTIDQAEPIGPKAMLDILLVAPCTGNTLGKLAGGITDSSVAFKVTQLLRIKLIAPGYREFFLSCYRKTRLSRSHCLATQ